MRLTSSAFQHHQKIPPKYTCDGQDISPPLRVEGVPSRTVSLVLIVDDPDAPAGIWDHWIVWNIPPGTTEIPEDSVPGVQGRNSWGRSNYGGPCPPGGTHRYVFKLYALDVELDLQQGAGKSDLERSMQRQILDKTELVGRYERGR